jgi:DNA-binding transcriptional LysR family regulator
LRERGWRINSQKPHKAVRKNTFIKSRRYNCKMSKNVEFDWDDLRYFLQAARIKTLAGAARALGVEHTTIGRRLTALERALGVQLFIRGPDGLRLTSLAERVLPLIEEVEVAVHAVQNQVMPDKLRVRLAVPSGFAPLITARLAALHHDHPDVTLELLSSSRPVDLKKGEAELALRIGPITDQDLVAQNMGEVGLSLYASNAYLARRHALINPLQLAGHEVIGYDQSLSALPGAKWLEAHATEASVVLRCREMTDMLAAANAGLGLAVLPCMLAETVPTLVRLTDQTLCRAKLSLVYRREMLKVDPVRVVIKFITSLMRGHLAPISGGDSRPAMVRKTAGKRR